MLGRAAALAVAALLCVPTAASAATLTRVNNDYVFTAAAGETNVVTLTRPDNNTYSFTDTAGLIDTTGSGCTGTTFVNCPSSGIAALRITLGDGSDTFDNAAVVSIPIEVHGNNGDDVIDGGDAVDILTGDAGRDKLTPGFNTDSVDGGTEADTINYRDDRPSGVTVNLTTFAGGDGETLTSIENVIGSDWADFITGDAFPNVIDGSLGADILNDGGGGPDLLSYESHNIAVVVNYPTTIPDGDVIFGTFEGIVGSLAGSDTLSFPPGELGERFLFGLGGADQLTGGSGPDRLDGGSGTDNLNGGAGADMATHTGSTPVVTSLLPAGPHQDGDTYTSIEGLMGGLGDDVLIGNGGANTLQGLSGSDRLIGGGGADILNGSFIGGPNEAFVDIASYEERSTPVTASLPGPGQDGDTYGNIDGFWGGTGDDVLTGDAAANTLVGLAGQDILVGALGADAIFGGLANGTPDASKDIVSYRDRSEPIVGIISPLGDGEDVVTDSQGVEGTSGHDNIEGGGGDGILMGGPGDDRIQPHGEGNTVDGGPGADRTTFFSNPQAVIVNLITGTTSLGDTLTSIEGSEGSSLADTFIGDALPNHFQGMFGNDTYIGGGGADTFEDFGGVETVSYDDGRQAGVTLDLNTNVRPDNDVYSGIEKFRGSGQADTLTGTPNADNLAGAGGNDTIVGAAGADSLAGDGGDDLLQGGAAADTLTGGDGTDTVSYAERGESEPVSISLDATPNDGAPGEGDLIAGDVENIFGGAGADTLLGSATANLLDGGGGADTITGGEGEDTLLGAAGDDTVEARDGAADAVDCGAGSDAAGADGTDAVTACETVAVDGDGDGIDRAADCDDTSAAIRPGASEILGNAVDENCDGRIEPFPTEPVPTHRCRDLEQEQVHAQIHDPDLAAGRRNPGRRHRRHHVQGAEGEEVGLPVREADEDVPVRRHAPAEEGVRQAAVAAEDGRDRHGLRARDDRQEARAEDQDQGAQAVEHLLRPVGGGDRMWLASGSQTRICQKGHILRRALLVAVLLTLLAAPAAHATTLYSTLDQPNDVQGINSDFADQTRWVAQSFVPTTSGTARSVAFFAQANFGETAVVSMSIHSDNAGQPGVALATGQGTVGDETGAAPTCSVLTDATPNLVAAQTYWAVFKGVNNDASWLYSRNAARVSKFTTTGGATWTTNAAAKTFSLRVEDTACGADIVPNPNPGESVGDFARRPGTSAFSTVFLGNSGTQPLIISGASFTGNEAGVFKLLQGEPGGPMAIPFVFPETIGAAAGAGLIMYVVCSPAAGTPDGLYTPTFTVTSNDPDEGTINWPASCLVDGTPPIVILTEPPAVTGENGWFINKPSVHISSADTGIGVNNIFCTDTAGPTLSLLGSNGDLTIISDGDHQLDCGASDKLGNATPAGTFPVHLKVDTTAPDAAKVSGPGSWTNQKSPQFAWSSTDATSGVMENECSVDGGSYESCTSPAAPDALADGVHKFEVRVRDFAGSYDATPVKWDFGVDTVPPETSIEFGPPALTASTSASVVGGVSDPPGGSGIAGLQCSLDAAEFTICPPMVTYENLAEGDHVAAVRARDRAGNVDPTPAEHEWTVDLTAPTAAFLSTPRALTSLQTANFTFEAVNAGPAQNESFLCKLDDAVAFTPCTSPASFQGFAKETSHTLAVAAVDTLGNVQEQPSVYAWTISDSPRAVDDQREAVADTPVELDVLANDLDPADGQLTPVLSSGATEKGGIISVSGAKVLYVPPAGFVGTDSFTYHVVNGGAFESTAATVAIEVKPKPIVPGGATLAGGTDNPILQSPLPDRAAPVVSKASVKRRKLTFTLSEAATATVVVKEFVKGRKKPVRRGKVTVKGRAGTNGVRIARRLLKQGRRYRLVIRAVDVAGNVSGRVSVKLTLR